MRKITVLLAVGVLLVLSGVALASIPDSNGVIHGCRKNSGGALRVIDTDAGQTCASNETAINWSQTGPAGPTGPQGPSGVSGSGIISTSLHTDSGLATKTTVCPDGEFAISGGHRYAPDGSPSDWNVDARRNEPANISAGLAQWWTVEVKADVPGTLTTYAHCLTRP